MHQVNLGISLSSSHCEGHVLMIIDDRFVAHNDYSATFTVWKKSLVFSGNGYTVFDSSGNLVFRVDNYAYDTKHQLFLMDAAGNVLLTLLHKRLSFNGRWEAYRGEDGYGCGIKPTFSVIKSASLLFSSKSFAKVVLEPKKRQNTKLGYYEIEGSFCKPTASFTLIFSASREIVGQVLIHLFSGAGNTKTSDTREHVRRGRTQPFGAAWNRSSLRHGTPHYIQSDY